MKMLKNTNFSIKVISQATEIEAAKSQILFDGKAVNSVIDGVICEACIQHEAFYLVFTTNDNLFEESLNIYLLDREFTTIDYATLVWPYGTGSFSLLEMIEPNVITFKFFGESKWMVELFARERILLPFISEPSGVWRKFSLKHHFRISNAS